MAIKRFHPQRGAGILKCMPHKGLRPMIRVRRRSQPSLATKFVALPQKIPRWIQVPQGIAAHVLASIVPRHRSPKREKSAPGLLT
jgi:hypothetical protein